MVKKSPDVKVGVFFWHKITIHVFIGMVVINRGQANIVTVTLKEKTTIANAYYLWEFTSKASSEKKYCIQPVDLSAYKDRFNQFTITETATPNPIAGQVTLALTGEWVYNVYEQASSTSLDPTGKTIVESGLVRVIGTATTDTQYTRNVTTSVYVG
jgi:VCBS repeat-containing protein